MKKKKTTIEDLAKLIEKKSEESKLHTKDEVEKLAMLVVDGFDKVKGDINEVKSEVSGLKGEIKGLQEKADKLGTRMASVEYGQYEIQKKLNGVASSYDLAKMDSKYERRFQKIEAKIGLKSKAK